MGEGILIAAMDFSTAAEDEFHDWYDLEHVPARARIPGFLACERWIGTKNPKQSIATYELDSVEVLHSAEYRAISGDNDTPWTKRMLSRVEGLSRIEGELVISVGNAAPDAPALLLNAMNIPPEHEMEFNEWYNKEHIPALAAVPGTLSAARYRGRPGGRHHYVALYRLASPDVPDSVAWKTAANTPWTEKLRPHFRDHLRIVTRRYRRGG
jgi:hypothetical protein